MTGPGKEISRPPGPRLFKKRVPDDEPITPERAVLFRLGGRDFPRPRGPRFFKKGAPDDEPITPESAVLFRFGEQCNNDCPMCSNTGEASLFFHPTETLLRRAAFLHDRGFRRAVVTGGEPTIHPGFWAGGGG